MVLSVSLKGVRNVAVVVAEAFTVVVQVRAVPAHAPVQPETMPRRLVAVSVTAVPASTFIEHVPEHLMTALDDCTWPSPTTVTVMEETPTLAAAFWAPMKSPTSFAAGAEQVPSTQIAL